MFASRDYFITKAVAGREYFVKTASKRNDVITVLWTTTTHKAKRFNSVFNIERFIKDYKIESVHVTSIKYGLVIEKSYLKR